MDRFAPVPGHVGFLAKRVFGRAEHSPAVVVGITLAAEDGEPE